jgi:hypothetical protein
VPDLGPLLLRPAVGVVGPQSHPVEQRAQPS